MIAFLGRGVVVLSFSTVFLGVLGLGCGLFVLSLVPILGLAFIGWVSELVADHRMKKELKRHMCENGGTK